MAVFVLVIYTPILRFINENKAFRGIALIYPKTQVSPLKDRNYVHRKERDVIRFIPRPLLPGKHAFL